ncbi:hypothetical protein DPMN_031374, partial [Dreissena polymorpha]
TINVASRVLTSWRKPTNRLTDQQTGQKQYVPHYYIQLVSSRRNKLDSLTHEWITEWEKNLKELVFARPTVRQGVETTWYVFERERNVEVLAKNEQVPGFQIQGFQEGCGGRSGIAAKIFFRKKMSQKKDRTSKRPTGGRSLMVLWAGKKIHGKLKFPHSDQT